jgi:hypothetical protein
LNFFSLLLGWAAAGGLSILANFQVEIRTVIYPHPFHSFLVASGLPSGFLEENLPVAVWKRKCEW